MMSRLELPQLVFVHSSERSDMLPIARSAVFEHSFRLNSFTGFESPNVGNPYNSGLYRTVLEADHLFVSEGLVVRNAFDARRALSAARYTGMISVYLFNSANEVRPVLADKLPLDDYTEEIA